MAEIAATSRDRSHRDQDSRLATLIPLTFGTRHLRFDCSAFENIATIFMGFRCFRNQPNFLNGS